MRWDLFCSRCKGEQPLGTRFGCESAVRCATCQQPLRYIEYLGEPKDAGPVLTQGEYARLSDWCMNHPDELEARGLSVAERNRARYWRWMTQTGRVTP